jgi:hypothetical protein
MSIEELEAYFAGIELPERIELEQGVMIEDLPLFLDSHLSYVKNNGDLKSAEVFLIRLNRLHEKLEALGNV